VVGQAEWLARYQTRRMAPGHAGCDGPLQGAVL
jgi:hypothetical protein